MGFSCLYPIFSFAWQLMVGQRVGVSTRQHMDGGGANDRPLSRSEILKRLRTDNDVRRATSDAAADPRNAPPADGVQNLPYVLPEDIGINRTTAQSTNGGNGWMDGLMDG